MRAREREEVLDLLGLCFGVRGIFERYFDHDPAFRPENVRLAVEAGRPVGCVQIFEKTIRLAGAEVPLGGIGSVATHPDCRGQGVATALLADADDRMRERGDALGLLFAARHRFYGIRGWVQVPMELLVVSQRGRVPAPGGVRGFQQTDLPQIMALYERANARRAGTTVRDESYWRGQLRYAGAPDETFRVHTRNGRIVAYARRIEFAGLHVMEHGCEEDEWEALAVLLQTLARPDRRLLIRNPQEHLVAELQRTTAKLETLRDPTPMWKVLDPQRLRTQTGVDGNASTLLDELIRKPAAHYWLSDRF